MKNLKNGIFNTLEHGVTVAQQILVLSVWVRIPAGVLIKKIFEISYNFLKYIT